MPRYRPESPLGYDLDLELAFVMIDGKKCQVGSAGSILLMCPTCGAARFRTSYRPGQETCWDGHGALEPVGLDDLDRWNKINPITTTKAERKVRRLEDEAIRPWNWVFGDLTEADFPEGFAEIGGEKVASYRGLEPTTRQEGIG